MLQFSNYKFLLKGVSLALVIVIAMFYFSSRQTNTANNTAFWVAHTQEVLFHSENLHAAAINIETGQRAYLLTGQPQFSDMYHASKNIALTQIKNIRELTIDNQIQQERLDTLQDLILQRIFFSDSIINLKTTIDKALEIVKHNEGKIYTDKIEMLTKSMQQEENRLLKIRRTANQQAILIQHRIFVYAIIAMLVLLVYISWKEKNLSIKKGREKADLQFRNLLESAADAMVVINEEKKIVLINQQTELLFGYTRKQLAGLPVQTLIPGYVSVRNHKIMAEHKGVKKSGTEFPLEISAAPILTDQGMMESISARDITESKQTADKLKKSEEFFRLLVKGVKDYAIFMIDLNGIVVSWNSGAEHIKGYKENEIIGKSFKIFYTKKDLESGEPFRNLEMAAKFGSFESKGLRLRKNGAQFWADIVFTALKDQDNKVYGYCKITRDITEEKRTQEQLEFQARQIDQSNDAIYIVDAELKIKTWNTGAENLYEYSKSEVLGKDPNQLLQTELTVAELDAALTEVSVQDYWTGELKRITKSGRQIHVHASTTSVRDEQGNITGYVSSSFDITSQIKLMQEVRHLADIVEQTSEAIFSRGTDNRIISWNKGAEKLFGINKKDALGKQVDELGYLRMDKTELQKNQTKLIENGFCQLETDMYRKDGTQIYCVVTGNTIKNDEGQITSFNFIVKDISKRKQLEEQLKRSNMEMEAFSYSVSHDLRAPLRAIAGFTTKLEENYNNKLDDEAKRITSIIKNSTLQMGNLIDDLLTFSRMSRQDIVKMNIDNDTMVKEIINGIVQNNDNVEWIVHPLQGIMADQNTIRQVWINLISNAVKYSAKKPFPKIEIGSYKENRNIVFYVKDNGIGFNEKYKSKLFKVFQRLHSADEFEGTGIGLAIVEKVISKHGGSVSVKAVVNEGACFSFSLPDYPAQTFNNKYFPKNTTHEH